MTPGWLPKKGLVREHHDYGTHCTDAPPIFHVAACLSALSAAVADTARLTIAGREHPLSIWTMLVGQSTADRKTTAAQLAVGRLRAVLPDRVTGIHGSPEGFLQQLEAQPTSLLFIPEGGAFFEQRQASYWRHARGMLMELFDCVDEFRRQLVSSKPIVIRHPRLSILCACALPLLEHHSRGVDWEGGFLPRFLMIAGPRAPFKAHPQDDPRQAAEIEEQLRRVESAGIERVTISRAGQRDLDAFALEINEQVDTFHPRLQALLNRLPEAASRLSALYEIAKGVRDIGRTEIVASAQSARHAIALCRASRDVALNSLQDASEDAGDKKDLARVERIIRDAGALGISRTALIRATRVFADKLDRVMITLLDGNLVERVEGEPPPHGGKAETRYVHGDMVAPGKRTAKA